MISMANKCRVTYLGGGITGVTVRRLPRKPNETTVQKSKNVSTKIPSLLVLAAQGNKWKQRMNMEKPRIWETWRIVEWLHPHMEYLFIGIYCIYSDIYIYILYDVKL